MAKLKVYNKENTKQKNISDWIRPWNLEKFDDLYDRDERFFSVLIKGVLKYLNDNIVLYNKSIQHFIFNTGSSYMYIESNGYEYSMNTVSGEDQMYMHMPRAIINLENITVPTEELTNPFSRMVYERRDGNKIRGFNADVRRLPIELNLNCQYVLSNFNELLVLIQELYDKLIFQKYFYITYLGETIECSIEFPADQQLEINKIDMTSTETNQKTITLSLKICSNYPIVDERTEVANDDIIEKFGGGIRTLNRDPNIEDKDKRILDTHEYQIQ